MKFTSKPIKSIEQLVNKVLCDDRDCLSRMNRLSGKCIELSFVNINVRIFIFPSSRGVELATTYEGAANVIIKGKVSDMLSYMLASLNDSSSQISKLEVIGDIGLAQEFQNIVKNIDLDWEEYISAYTGDIFAHKLGNIFKAGTGYATYSKNKIREDFSEYMLYEKKILLSEIEVKEFVSEIDVLRDDVERLKLRVDRLSTH